MGRILLLVASLALAGGACASDSASSAAGDGGPESDAPRSDARRKLVFGGARPAVLRVPASYDPDKTYPLVVVLHGYSASGLYQATYLGFIALAAQREMLLVYPDGTKNLSGIPYWNASPACCRRDASPEVDDVAYLDALIAEISDSYRVDPKRIYLVGHSNGGYMAYRMACDKASRVAAIVSLAGASRQRQNCAPSEPVSVLHVHGDNDPTVRFDGDGSGEMAYPGALASLANWASYDGCSGQLVADSGAGAKLDLDSTIAGAETEVSRYAGCPAGIDLELWRIVGGGHLPLFVTPTIFAELTFDWLLAHPKR